MPDFVGMYNTPLSPQDEVRFRDWAARAGKMADLEDYDLRGAWLDNAQAAQNGHLPDTWKKPNHPTFSTESKYNGSEGIQGGRWIEKEKGKWAFQASLGNLTFRNPEELARYFAEREPDATLEIAPDSPNAAVNSLFPAR